MNKELIDISTFCSRMKIGRSTAFNWIARGILVAGIHFIRQGHVLRILWDDALIGHLLECSVKPNETPRVPLLRKKEAGRQGHLAFDEKSVDSMLDAFGPVKESSEMK